MKLGLNLLNYGPDTTPELLLAWARFAEESGFALAMMSDHVAMAPEVQALYPVPFYEPFTAITWLAAHTTRLRLGTSVSVLPYRHPLQTARVGANLADLSHGRFVLGVGSGWSQQEYDRTRRTVRPPRPHHRRVPGRDHARLDSRHHVLPRASCAVRRDPHRTAVGAPPTDLGRRGRPGRDPASDPVRRRLASHQPTSALAA